MPSRLDKILKANSQLQKEATKNTETGGGLWNWTVNGVKGVYRTKTAQTVKPKAQWLLKKLIMPPALLSHSVEGTGELIARTFRGEEPYGSYKDIMDRWADRATKTIKGQEIRTFSDMWREHLPDHPYAATAIGLYLDVFTDPITWIGVGGLTTT